MSSFAPDCHGAADGGIHRLLAYFFRWYVSFFQVRLTCAELCFQIKTHHWIASFQLQGFSFHLPRSSWAHIPSLHILEIWWVEYMGSCRVRHLLCHDIFHCRYPILAWDTRAVKKSEQTGEVLPMRVHACTTVLWGLDLHDMNFEKGPK